MSLDHFRYDLRAQDALRNMVRNVLADTARKGLPGEHHFFISFDTRADGVRLSNRLRDQYPDEMTIVLQHQFWDLKVSEESFEVGLSFNGVAERLLVPFAAIKSFVDPSVQFALQFEQVTETQDNAPQAKAKEVGKPRRSSRQESRQETRQEAKPDAKPEPRRSVPSVPRVPAPPVEEPRAALAAPKAEPAPPDDKPDKPKRGGSGAEVVRLDRFRKK
jgi:uncharacterized protein